MRRAAVAREASDRGLSALVLFSRGVTTVDFYGDVMYLADFHSAFPVVPDAAVCQRVGMLRWWCRSMARAC